MTNNNFNPTLDYAKSLDENDSLSSFKERFYPLENNQIYMDGNSLGLASIDAEKALLRVIEVWKSQGILIWNTDQGHYFNYGKKLGARLSKLIKAEPDEVLVTANTTLNIHQVIATFWQPTKQRYKILVDDLNFPTDRYAIDSQIRLKGMQVEDVLKVVTSQDGMFIDEQSLIDVMTEDVAIVLLPSVLYRSAQLLDIERLTKEAHRRGIIIGFDLCHSIGAVEHDFKAAQPDFAIWCNYKYLSAGPGATAGIYVNRKHFGKTVGLAGWFGNSDETQFELKHDFEQSNDIKAFQTGTPNMFSMAPLEGVLDIYEEAGMARIRKKSLLLTTYMMYLIEEKLTQWGYTYISQQKEECRGGHVALVHPEAYRICLALKARNFIPDYREPDIIRLAPVALYNTFEQVYLLVEELALIARDKAWEAHSAQKAIVT